MQSNNEQVSSFRTSMAGSVLYGLVGLQRSPLSCIRTSRDLKNSSGMPHWFYVTLALQTIRFRLAPTSTRNCQHVLLTFRTDTADTRKATRRGLS